MTRVLSAERYVLALLVATQRWAPPALVLVGVIAWIWVTPPISIVTVRIALLALFALAAWLGHATGTCEEPGQELIGISCRGSATRLLAARWLTATVLAAAFPLLMLGGTYAYDRLTRPDKEPLFTSVQAMTAALAIVAVAAVGAALGVLVASVIPAHPGWAAGLLIIASLAQAAPWMLPVPPLAATLPGPAEPFPPVLLLEVVLWALLAVALLVAARLLRRPVR